MPENKKAKLATLIVPRNQAIERLRNQLHEYTAVFQQVPSNPAQLQATVDSFVLWRDYTRDLLLDLFGSDQVSIEFADEPQTIRYGPYDSTYDKYRKLLRIAHPFYRRLLSIIRRAQTLYHEACQEADADTETDAIDTLEYLAERFDRFITQLAARRRTKRRGLTVIRDEYDLQDLLFAVLRLVFDDVRPEEPTPTLAGGSSRMDFLLMNELTVVEAKMTREGLADKQVGDQLILDIARYRSHPKCRKLVCLVYDPKRKIRNPVGLEKDLSSKSTKRLKVRLFIFPK